MQIETITRNGSRVAVLHAEAPLIHTADEGMNTFMSLRYEADSKWLAVDKAAFAEDFFVLSTGIAGDLLQRLVNYQFRLAIIGDYGHYTSKPLHDFIRESNKGKDVYFVATLEEALDKLCGKEDSRA